MNASSAQTSSKSGGASGPSTSLRPRANRLISGLVEGDETDFEAADRASRNRIESPLLSPYDSRSASPIPAPHPQRTGTGLSASPSGKNSWSSRRSQLGGQPKSQGDAGNTLAGLWGSSWSTLQGLATDFLNNDLPVIDGKTKGGRERRPLNGLNDSRSTSRNSRNGEQWGPKPRSNPTDRIGIGTREEHEAAVRAEKRKHLLLRGNSAYGSAIGQYKRRLSDDYDSMSAPPGGDKSDRSALVYLHHVKKDDTLAGITIRYNISANELRKANRMWPNDAVQTRTTLVLPVTACAVKGKPISNGQAHDLLDSEIEALSAGQAEEVETPRPPLGNGKVRHNRGDSVSTNTTNTRDSSAPVGTSSIDTDPPWHHDSWVILSGQSLPTEIARLSRRTMTYFPPARRKSVLYSDGDTPPRSLELTRSSISNDADPVFASPSRDQGPRQTGRARRQSNAENGYHPSYLAGPGGVGTMDRNVHFPGPAQDGLNKMFARYLSDVAPPTKVSEPADTLTYPVQFTPLPSGATTPNSHNNSSNLNLENVGGQIESWVRRVAAQAKQSIASNDRGAGSPRGPRISVGMPGKGRGAIGELIEMTDEFELGGDDNDEAEELQRGRRGSTIHIGTARTTTSAIDQFGGTAARNKSKATSGPKNGKSD